MKSSKTVSSLIVAALILFAVSFVWPLIDRGSLSFSEDDARQYQQASIDLHSRIHQHGHSPHGRDHPSPAGEDAHGRPSELSAAWDRFNAARAKRDAALARGSKIGWIIRGLAILCAVGGIASFVNQQKKQASADHCT